MSIEQTLQFGLPLDQRQSSKVRVVEPEQIEGVGRRELFDAMREQAC